ncbi:sugar ABC transporter ATP-binding protein [Rhodoluna lacicola]|uniref:ABC-type sugar transport system, ATPase component n=1 Tax=Rhodoluna lacicola TaxID=529884 RepID=A0A060JJY1_9MICO|nr:sugar ABC transporter ATP-binding protein [Rhodoluna lacicola]AIC46928.1 ABC-type sugar transport system, ATPase component [Rhodoluna lacicola]
MTKTKTPQSGAHEEVDSLMRATRVSKAFNGIYAVKDVDFELKPGEVHALLGPNGSGKSTLIKMLDGVQPQDEGTIEVSGRSRNSKDVATVFQELSLIPSLSVAQNIFLGNELRNSLGLVQTREMNRISRQLTERLGLNLSPDELVENLSVASRQLVEIAKAIHRSASVLVLDEPTSTLTTDDQILLFKSIRDIQKTGVGIIYVTHRLGEVFEIANRVTVLRDGKKVLTAKISEIDMASLVEVITGTAYPAGEVSNDDKETVASAKRGSIQSKPRLEISNLSSDKFSNISLRVNSGQIIGVAGLTGTGRTELLETVSGIRSRTGGEIKIDGKLTSFKNVSEAVRAGVALVPEDRHGSGICLEHSISRNLQLAHAKALSRGPFLNTQSAQELVGNLMKTLQIKAASPLSAVQSLSGGNQQKVVFAKWMQPSVKVLLLDEPTQGVDVGSRKEIYRVIRRFADEGVGVLVVSSDFVELQQLCDEIYFMTSSSISAPESVTERVTEHYIYSKLSERVTSGHEQQKIN